VHCTAVQAVHGRGCTPATKKHSCMSNWDVYAMKLPQAQLPYCRSGAVYCITVPHVLPYRTVQACCAWPSMDAMGHQQPDSQSQGAQKQQAGALHSFASVCGPKHPGSSSTMWMRGVQCAQAAK
jgi:hypothetical protein